MPKTDRYLKRQIAKRGERMTRQETIAMLEHIGKFAVNVGCGGCPVLGGECWEGDTRKCETALAEGIEMLKAKPGAFEIKPENGGYCVTIDGKEIRGVTGIDLKMRANETPVYTINGKAPAVDVQIDLHGVKLQDIQPGEE